MEIEFHGQYDKQIFFKAVALANRPSQRNIIIRIASGLVFLSIYIAYFTVVATKDSYSTADVFRAGRHLITFLIVGYFLFQPFISSRITASRLWEDPNIRKTFRGRISSMGISYIYSTSENDLKWESFIRGRKGDDFVVLLTADGVLSVFPQAFFINDNEWRKFQQLVESKVKEPI
jgi:hypothetical protein